MANKALHIASQALSILLYPLFIPTYGTILYCFALQQNNPMLNAIFWLFAIAGSVVFTLVIPLSAIAIMIRKKQVSDIFISNPKERTIPYIYTACCYGFWCYFLHTILHVSQFFFLAAVGATVALLLVTLINRKWKISAHLCGLGGLTGGLIAYALTIGQMPSFGFISLVLGIALILMYARLYLNEHTDRQVVAGYLLGIVCTLLPNLIAIYV